MIDLRYVKKLLEMVDASSANSIEITSDKGVKIRISKTASQRGTVQMAAPMQMPQMQPTPLRPATAYGVHPGPQPMPMPSQFMPQTMPPQGGQNWRQPSVATQPPPNLEGLPPAIAASIAKLAGMGANVGDGGKRPDDVTAPPAAPKKVVGR